MRISKIIYILIVGAFFIVPGKFYSMSGGNDTLKGYSAKFNIDNCINTFSMNKTIKTDAGYQYVEHRIRNAGNTEIKYLVIKKYPKD